MAETIYLVGGPADLTKVAVERRIPVHYVPVFKKLPPKLVSDDYLPTLQIRKARYVLNYRTPFGWIYTYDGEEQ